MGIWYGGTDTTTLRMPKILRTTYFDDADPPECGDRLNLLRGLRCVQAVERLECLVSMRFAEYQRFWELYAAEATRARIGRKGRAGEWAGSLHYIVSRDRSSLGRGAGQRLR